MNPIMLVTDREQKKLLLGVDSLQKINRTIKITGGTTNATSQSERKQYSNKF